MHTIEETNVSPVTTQGMRKSRREESSLLDLLIVTVHHRGMILKLVLVALLLSTALAFLLPCWYRASVILLPPQSGNSNAIALMAQMTGAGAVNSDLSRELGLKNPGEMYVAMMQSRPVEEALVRRFDLMARYRKSRMSLAREALEAHAKITANAKDGLLHLEVEDRDPTRAAELANAWVEEFQKLTGSMAVTEAGQRRVFFQHQMEQAKDDLAAAEESLKDTQLKTGVIEPDVQARALIGAGAELRAQIAAKEVEIRGLKSFATPQNPDLIMAGQELAELQAQEASLNRKQGGNAGLIPAKGQVSEATLEYVRKLRDVKYYETVFQILARQFEIAKLDEAREGTMVQVVESAVPPDHRSRPRRALLISLFTLGGLLLGIIGSLVAEGMEKARQRPENQSRLQALRAALGSQGGK